jgi:glutamate-1-semialdehyde 2,1-aminomutase
VKKQVVILPFTEKAYTRISRGDIAIVMIEPVQASLPLNRKTFLENLKEVCVQSNTVLCFDEVISGFRMSLGGAAEYYGVKPDLVAYGKIAGGGFPVGIVGGDAIMDVVKTGVRMGGTFSANPLTVAGCAEMLKRLLKNPPYNYISSVMIGLINIRTENFHFIVNGCMARLMFMGGIVSSIKKRDKEEVDKNEQASIIAWLMTMGLFVSCNHNFYFSTLHTDKDIEFIENCMVRI